MGLVRNYDDSQRLQALVLESQNAPLQLLGQGTKAQLLPPPRADAQLLSVAEHQGIEFYAPEELVVTVRAGTPLRDLETLLAQHDQMLAFEPPQLNGGGTIGGAVATGLAGPGRPWRGAVRDAVLGVEMLNGLGQRLRFGGQVMKNVAGYDLSRLQVGACGHFGLLLSISLRVSPRPMVEQTVKVPLSADQYQQLRTLAAGSAPVTALAVDPQQHPDFAVARLAGAAGAVAAAVTALNARELSFAQDYWAQLRDRQHPIFVDGDYATEQRLYRISLPLGTQALPIETAAELIEWGGALRWVRSSVAAAELAAQANLVGGHLCLGGHLDPNNSGTLYQADLVQRLRMAFDPNGVFNPLGGARSAD